MKIHPLDRLDLDRDPRGVLWVWEPPDPGATYCMGIDPTVGIVGWHRSLRRQGDTHTDNGAIEILRVGRPGEPDRQVAEYAAPIDPEELGEVAVTLGRHYRGRAEEECHCIIEVYPGPGLLTLRRMRAREYANMFQWSYLDSAEPRPTQYLGWTATPKSVRDLWIRGRRHMLSGALVVKSPWLVEEMASAAYDPARMTARAEMAGSHDDRLRAILLTLWAAHSWSSQVEIPAPETKRESAPEWQASDCSEDEMMSQWSERFAEMGGE